MVKYGAWWKLNSKPGSVVLILALNHRIRRHCTALVMVFKLQLPHYSCAQCPTRNDLGFIWSPGITIFQALQVVMKEAVPGPHLEKQPPKNWWKCKTAVMSFRATYWYCWEKHRYRYEC